MAELRYTVEKEDEGRKIRELLRRQLSLSSRFMKKVKYSDGVRLNGHLAKLGDTVWAGDVIEVVFPEEDSWFEPEDIGIEVVYDDADLMVVNKRPGMVVHPTKNCQSGTLINGAAFYSARKGETCRLRLVNRLDRDTSGLVIIAKNPHAQDRISREMQTGRVVKKYLAVVHGIVEEGGRIDAPIGKEPGHPARRTVIEGGMPSVTYYRPVEIFRCEGTGQLEGYTLLECRLVTGRTHQIRAHMTWLGHPIVGDELYAQLFGCPENPEWMPRQALHAAHLEFDHPVSGVRIILDSPLPEDIRKCLEHIKSLC